MEQRSGGCWTGFRGTAPQKRGDPSQANSLLNVTFRMESNNINNVCSPCPHCTRALCMEFYQIFDFVHVTRLLVGVFTAKQNHSGLQQYMFKFFVHVSVGQLRFIWDRLSSSLVWIPVSPMCFLFLLEQVVTQLWEHNRVDLNQGWFCFPGIIWQCMGTFGFHNWEERVTTGT